MSSVDDGCGPPYGKEWAERKMSEQPHPSDGSMTAKQVEWEMSEQPQECNHNLAERETACYADGLCPICLNAALADERERLEKKWKASMVDVTTLIQNLEQQLAAERKKVKELVELCDEVARWHRDKDSPEYNGCENEPCGWCEAWALAKVKESKGK